MAGGNQEAVEKVLRRIFNRRFTQMAADFPREAARVFLNLCSSALNLRFISTGS
jgi:hypothetical protein